MRVLVVDDEPLARRRLIRMLGRVGDVEVAGQAENTDEAVGQLRSTHVDLMLLDIDMPGRSGVELARSGEKLPPIVFTTAHKQYAVDAFEVSAVDYLVKPVSQERLAAALEKVRRLSGSADTRLEALLDRLEERSPDAAPARLHARFGGSTRLIDAREVTRICASAKYALFHHQGREFVLDESLNALEVRLVGHGFMRIHRGELVNLEHVCALHVEDGATSVELSDGQRAAVGRRLVGALKQRLGIVGGRTDPSAPSGPRSGGGVERRLVAILSADAVGYSRLMADDELATVQTITACREEMERFVRRHRGRVVDSPGDNLLAVPGPTDAIHCAVAIQSRLRTMMATMPAKRRMPFRVGIHLGEVLVDGPRIYGDGVNVAARLEGLAPPGGIYTSAIVREQVEGKVDAVFEDVGEHEVKNIPKSVRVFRVTAAADPPT